MKIKVFYNIFKDKNNKKIKIKTKMITSNKKSEKRKKIKSIFLNIINRCKK